MNDSKINIFDYALENEKKQEEFYQDLLKKTQNKGLRSILLMLIKDEQKHFEIVSQMKKDIIPKMTQTDIIKEANTTFDKMRNRQETENLEISQVDLYIKARELEKMAEENYQTKAQEVANKEIKEIFLMLAKEENKHYLVLDNIIELLMRPHHWLENAEMNHSEAY